MKMGRTRNVKGTRPWLIDPRFVGSDEFTIAVAALLTLVGLAAPLLLICYQHLSLGRLDVGCAFGSLGLVVTGVSVGKLSSSLRRAKHRFSVHDLADEEHQ